MTGQPKEYIITMVRIIKARNMLMADGYHNADVLDRMVNLLRSRPAPAAEHRTYESCHKRFACPDGEECWYASEDYYWDCGKGASKLLDEFVRGKKVGGQQERKKLLGVFAEVEYLHDVDGITYPDLYNEFIQRYKSLRSTEAQK